MATLTVWKFDSPTAADEVVGTLESLAKQELITVHDAATVSWEEGKKKPKTRQLHSLVGAGAMGGMFWGMLFGLIFFVPLLGAAIGAASGALGKLAGRCRDRRRIHQEHARPDRPGHVGGVPDDQRCRPGQDQGGLRRPRTPRRAREFEPLS